VRFYKYQDDQNQLLLSCWKDKKICFCISTTFGNEEVVISRKKLEEIREEMEKDDEDDEGNEQSPAMILEENENQANRQERIEEETKENSDSKKIPFMLSEYMKNFKGVDKFNQAASYYLFSHKCVKWYRTIIMWLWEIAINNSFFLYKRFWGDKKYNSLDFRLEIIRELKREYLEKEEELMRDKKSNKTKECKFGQQIPVRQCSYCSMRSVGKRVRSSWVCLKCKIFVC